MNAMHVHKALLLDVLKVADVFKAIITTDKDKPVHLLSASGVKYKLNKSEFVNNFTTLQGEKLRLIKMKYNKAYLVAKLQNTPCFAVKIPKNATNKSIKMPDGKIVGPGKVIVVDTSKITMNGDYVDISQGIIISDESFRKTCVIKDISGEFREQLMKSNVLGKSNNRTQKPAQSTQPVQPAYSAAPSIDYEPNKQNTYSSAPISITGLQDDNTATESQAEDSDKGRICAIIKYNNTDIVAGYEIKTGSTSYTLQPHLVIMACKEGMIANATCVTNANGTEFIRGIGISLSDLPVKYI